jgi:hypothetical protein
MFKSKKTELVTITGCGSEILDVVNATVNYEIEGDGAILLHTEDLRGLVTKIEDHLNATFPGYEGLVLLRK